MAHWPKNVGRKALLWVGGSQDHQRKYRSGLNVGQGAAGALHGFPNESFSFRAGNYATACLLDGGGRYERY